jgi:hypothetical protein
MGEKEDKIKEVAGQLKDIADKAVEKDEAYKMPSPRFDLISKMFGEVDQILADNDAESNLTVFEMEILILMLRKKIDHLGIMAAIEPDHSDDDHKGNPEVYQ